jgi:hypothetical protein
MLFLFSVEFALSQSTNGVMSIASGDWTMKSSNSHSFSVGESINSVISNAKSILSQGFLQPINGFYLFANRNVSASISLKTWPVPANTFINISIDFNYSISIDKYEIHILNVNGEVLTNKVAMLGTNSFACDNWPTGTYFIELIGDSKLLTTKTVSILH